jgi:hypothetical protein
MKKKFLEKNEFFDINKLPKDEGLLIFPLSMSRLLNAHSPIKIIKDLQFFSEKKASIPKIGVNFVYTDFLYLNSNEKSSTLKEKFTEMIWQHSNGLKKTIFKHKYEFQIQHAFSYMTWSQLYLLSSDFINYFKKFKEIYQNDKLLQKYIREDIKTFNQKINENQINFFLEENLLTYLIIKGQLKLPNEFIQGYEKWVLVCYLGNPIKSFVYLFQKNFFKLPKIQPYEGLYNLETKKFIDFDNVDLETYSVK